MHSRSIAPVLVVLIAVAFGCFSAPAAATTGPRPNELMQAAAQAAYLELDASYNWLLLPHSFGRMLAHSDADASSGTGGGTGCAGCVVVLGIVEGLSIVDDASIEASIEKFCRLLPSPFGSACTDFFAMFGNVVIEMLENNQTPDAVCQEIHVCTNATCRLFPAPTVAHTDGEYRSRLATPLVTEAGGWDPFYPIYKQFYKTFNNHLPFIDRDNDTYSVYFTLRSSAWRGKDCDDKLSDIHPGRRVNNYGPEVDHNCNGIAGTDPSSGDAWEDVLCGGTTQYGLAILGDSAAAHFHIPEQYLNASAIDGSTYANLLDIAFNEADWPHMSSATGYMNSTWQGAPVGPVDSSYLRYRARNLCMHRDYQNIAVNGARAGAMASSIVQTLSRNQTLDYPLLLTYSLVGNDVCNGHIGTGHMTTPQEFYTNVVAALQYLDKQLPPGSHVSFFPLVDGRVLFDSMHDRIHPIGWARQDVTYTALYDYLNCLEISPCWGWMNSNATDRNETTARAMELNAVYPEIIRTNKFANFDMIVFDEHPMTQVINDWVANGGQAWQLIEEVDGFHPNQIANAQITQWITNLLMTNESYSYLLPPINPNNDLIAKMFGDQGGY